MATGTLYFSVMDVQHGPPVPPSTIWSNWNTVIEQYNTVTAVTDTYSGVNQYRGGSIEAGLGSEYGEPISLDSCLVRFWDSTSAHTTDEIKCVLYNPDTDALEILETFNAGNTLPFSNTEFDYTAALQTKFAAAADKRAFLAGLKLRWQVTSVPVDDIKIATRGIKIEYTYVMQSTIDARVVDRLTKTATLDAELFSTAPAPPRPIGYDPDFGTPAHHEFIVVVGHDNVFFGEF